MFCYGVLLGLFALSASISAISSGLQYPYPSEFRCSHALGMDLGDYESVPDVKSLFNGKYFDYTICLAKNSHLVDGKGNLNDSMLKKGLKEHGYLDGGSSSKFSACLSRGGNLKQKLECVVNVMVSRDTAMHGVEGAIDYTVNQLHYILLGKPQWTYP